MSAYPSSTPLPITSLTDVEATINGYLWGFTPGSARVLNWSVSGSRWNSSVLESTETQQDFSTLFSFISYYINVDFNFLGYFPSSGNNLGYLSANAAGSNLNIAFAYNGVNASGQTVNDGRFQNTSQTAFCYFPSTQYDTTPYRGGAGDTWLNWNNPFIRSLDFEVGSNGFSLLLHEVLHGLGLKHPHDGGSTGRPTYTDLDIPFADRQWISVMSYDRHESGGDGAYTGSMPIAPMIMDVIALQYLYGESTGSAGATVHDLSKYLGTYYNTLWDYSGQDTLDASKLGFGVAGHMGANRATNGTNEHNIGFLTTATDVILLAESGYNPSRWTWLWGEYENFNGSGFADVVSGNELNNMLNGGGGDDILEGGEGDDTFDWDATMRGGADTFKGGPGNDRYVLNSPQDRIEEEPFEGIDTVFVGFDYSIQGKPLENVSALRDMPVGVRFTGNDWHNELTGGAQADVLIGLEGNDTLTGLGGNDSLLGGTGLDTASYAGARALYSVQRSGADWRVADSTGATGIDSLTGIERIRFQDIRLALDCSPNGHAHSAALAIRALEGPQALRDRAEVGEVLSQFDAGRTLLDVVTSVIASADFLRLAGSRSNVDFVKFVYKNVVGVAPSSPEINYFAGLLDSGQFTQATLGVLAATVDVNALSAEIVGIAQTGLEFTPLA